MQNKDQPSASSDGEEVLTVQDADGATSVRSVDDVRQGRTGVGVRYVLLASFLGAALTLLAIVFIFARK